MGEPLKVKKVFIYGLSTSMLIISYNPVGKYVNGGVFTYSYYIIILNFISIF